VKQISEYPGQSPEVSEGATTENVSTEGELLDSCCDGCRKKMLPIPRHRWTVAVIRFVTTGESPDSGIRTPVGQERICRIPQHALDGIGAAFFSSNRRSTNPRAHPLSRHFRCRHPFRNFRTLSRISKSVPTGRTQEKPREVPSLIAAAYSRASKLEGSNCFPTPDLTPEVTGHSMTTSETKVDMSTVPETIMTLRTYSVNPRLAN